MKKGKQMSKVSYDYFDDKKDYPKWPNQSRKCFFYISKYDLLKYAILNGRYNNHTMSCAAKKFYSSICKVAVKKNKGFWVISDDYEYAENTYKTVISFAMGMLATRIIANKVYHVSRLYHFTEKRFGANLSKGKMSPDWFGLNQQMQPFLFESKGTVEKKIGLQTMDHATNQLKNVNIITDTSSGKPYNITNRHIICSCFNSYNNVNKVWSIHDVDPVERGGDEFWINIDKECFLYYDVFIKYVESLNVFCEHMVINKQDYYCWIYDNEMYCILGKIYDLIKSGNYNEENDYRNFNNIINEVLINIEDLEQILYDASSYEDGIIICNPNIEDKSIQL